jgi:hypothetical protein
LVRHDRIFEAMDSFCFKQQIQNFGEPFFLVIHEGETLAEIKVRLQKKLQVPDEEFAKVHLTSDIYPMLHLYICSITWLGR